MMLNDKEHWESFYGAWRLLIPSQFCSMVALDLQPGDQVVEFGCGNGRDAICFSMFGATVLALDASSAAIAMANELASKRSDIKVRFAECDVADGRKLAETVNAWHGGARTLYYARFFFHSIDEDREDKLLAELHKLMRPDDVCYLEFRTLADQQGRKEFGQHYRRYIEPAKLVAKLESLGFSVRYCVEGKGMAVFKGEDATVARIIFSL